MNGPLFTKIYTFLYTTKKHKAVAPSAIHSLPKDVNDSCMRPVD